MSPHARRRLAPAVASALVLSAACEGEVIDAAGLHLDYAHSPTLTPCAGNLAHMDGFVPFVAGQLGQDAADFSRFSYTWLDDRAYHRIAPPLTGGFARGADANGLTPIFLHELTHLVVHDEVALRRNVFLSEGLAVALEDLEHGGRRHRAADPLPFIDDNTIDDGFEFYGVAGGLVAYLLGRYGPERLYDLHRRIDASTDADGFAAAFAAVYGLSLADALADRDAPCPEGLAAAPLPYACVAPTIPWESDDRWIYRRTLDCASDPDVRGGVGEDGRGFAETAITVDVVTGGAYVLALHGDPGLRAVLGACAACPWLLEDLEVAGEVPRTIDLAPGRHAIKIFGPADEVVLAGVSLVYAP